MSKKSDKRSYTREEQLIESQQQAGKRGFVGREGLPQSPVVPYQNQTLQTVRPVQVQFQKNLSAPLQRHLQFQMIGGGETRLNVQMVNTRLITFGFYLVWGGIMCAGLCLLNTNRKTRMIFVFAVMLAGTLLVLVPQLELFAPLCDEAVKAAFWVLVIYLLAWGIRKVRGKARSTERRARSMECKAQSVPSASTTSIVVILLASVIFSGIVRADDAADKTPVALPDGVIVAFYDADSVLAAPLLKDGLPDPNVLSQGNQKLLVPYSKYVELWNLVHSETKVETPEKPPVDYVMTFGGYKAMLAASDELSVTGHAEMELLVDQPVLFPLPVRQGILTSLNVDGKNAEATISKQNGAEASGLPDGVFVVQMHGKGKHKIDFTVKFKVERQGGWRLAAGRLPEFPASKVLLELPEERMELRCNDVFAQQKWQAETAGETVETSLGRGGEFRWSWRSKVTEAEIDQSLTADSEIRFNIREDSLVFDWDLTLSFRRGKHESFRVRIPSDYLVVSVNGENVRGWENIESGSPDSASAGSASAEGALIEVELLHAAQESEQFHLTLMKNADLVEAKNTTVLTPNVSVVGAAMHHGRITLQNSPRLEIKPSDVSNLSMTDMPDAKQPVATQNPARNPVAENPLGLTAFRAYRFTTENYQLPLVVGINQQMPDHMINNIVKLSIHEVKLESNCQLRLGTNSEDRFTERLILPAGLRPDSVSSQQPIEWSTKPLESGETELTVLWAVIPNNRNLVFNVMGTKPRLPDEKFDLPILLPQTHENVAQYFVIQTDPAFDAGLDETNNFTTMGNTVPNWITPEQRSLCRLQLFASTSGELFRKVSAKLTLIPREPVVTVESITNMQVNSQSVEESVLLDFNIQNAGIRSVQFEIPKRMADARIDAPLLQRKELKESENGETVLVTLLLQDEIMNEFRVLIRNNRELVSGKHYDATIPKIRTGRVLNQYVVLENAGSLDELQIGDGKDGGKPVNMRKISRQHKEWGNLAAILGGNATEAYLAAGDNAAGDNAAGDNAAGDDPRLEFSMVRRETVKMSGARIGLAETRIVLDENGDYLAEQIYRIDNKTEQFLDLKLPAGAELWVVRILTNQEWDARQAGASGDFGQPVKPTTLGKESPVVDESPIHGVQSVKAATHVRIPIIKTEVGDLDYIVRVVYAGKCGKIQWLSKLDMPFIEVLNIPVAASYASLQLPEQYKFQFDGTMSKVDQAVVSRTVSQYEAQKIADLKQTAQTGSPYEQARAISNLSLKGIVPSSSDYTVAKPVYETRQGRQYNQAQSGRRPGFETQQFDTQQQQIAGTPVYTNNAMPTASNSMQLEQRFASQNMARGKNVVVQSENNWKPGENENRDFAPNQSNNPKFAGWLSKNGLENPQTNDASKKESDEKMSGEHYARDLIRPETEKGEVAESNRENASRNPENYSRSRLLGEDRQQQAMTSNSSLKNQERLNDQQLASKLSTNRSSFADDSKGNTSGQSVFAFDMKYMQSASERQTNLPQEQTKNVDLYRQRLAVQNSSQSSVQQGTPTPVVSESLPTQSVRPPAGTAMPSSGMGSGMGMAAGSMPGSSGMSGIGSGSGMGMSGSGGRSSSTRRSGETPAPMPTPSATPALELAGGPAA
ncbi:MAG: hypothetical protein FWC50_07390, partial [Planctomycetaceae bacterium]|nr:hypothetical protein [Planctomycetaceae bacterium]